MSAFRIKLKVKELKPVGIKGYLHKTSGQIKATQWREALERGETIAARGISVTPATGFAGLRGEVWS